ncbi:MAG TPA: hypothetical protein VGB08_10785, partial [Allosphingosinicella sp.]
MASGHIVNSTSGVGAALALALVAAGLAAPSPAGAQPAGACAPAGAERRIEFGTCRRSSIDANDPRTEDGTRHEDWRIRLQRGQAVQIDMDAATVAGDPPEPVFDTFLELRRAGVDEPVASNDDRPSSLDARIRYTAPEAGDYVVRARPLAPDARGDYVLRVGAPPSPPPVAALEPGRVSGAVDAGAP